jgi:3-hydroxybutyryl-CoA dehydrogenase
VLQIEQAYFDASGQEEDRPTALLQQLVAQGHLGISTGRGFYAYPHPAFERQGWIERDSESDTGSVL